MPEEQGWKYGQYVMVMEDFDTTPYTTKDPGPKAGDVGTVKTINTCNGVVQSVGLMFETRSWVIDVDLLYNPEADNE